MLKMEKALTIVFGALVLAGVLACGSSSGPTPPPVPGVAVPGAPVIPGMPVAPVAVPQVVQPGAAMESSFGTVTLSTGFVPDPKVAQGQAGGAVDVSTLPTNNPECKGWIFAAKPDHVFVAQTAFGGNFRILAHSMNQPLQDITLVIQRPDGTYACNDDEVVGTQTDPIVQGQQWPAGVYKVWVGSYNQGERSSYRLGFTEMSNVTTASLQNSSPN